MRRELAQDRPEATASGRHHAYPGARPLRFTDSSLLVKRENDLARLEYAIANRQVIEVTAPSGTGKSSLLSAGLRQRLKGRYTVVSISQWANVSDLESRGLRYYYRAIRAAFEDPTNSHETDGQIITLPDDPYIGLTMLRDRYGKSLVIIFDQFEELMRVNTQIAQDFLTSVREAAKLFPFRQVLSLRSEFKDQLSELESKLAPTLWQWVRIEELGEGAERDVITVTHDEKWPIDEDVTDLIATAWREARARGIRIGLLHLQAMLWVIEDESRRSGLETGWTRRDLATHSALFRELSDADDFEADEEQDIKFASIVESSLRRYFEASVDELEDALVASAGSVPWLSADSGKETRGVIAGFVRSLSSAGYKVSQSEDDLFLEAFDEWSGLREKSQQVKSLRRLWFRNTERKLAETNPAVLLQEALAGGFQESLAKNDDGSEAVLRGNMLNGRLAGMEALPALAELTVVFERALSWMKQRDIVRITPDLDGNRLVTLIHDGYGEALNAWGTEALRDPEVFFTSLIGSSGTAMLTNPSPSPHDRVVRSLRWPGCSIDGVDFTDMIFEDCDFRGAVFVFCTFRNVRFERCYMPGTLFMKCVVEGEGVFFDETITRTLTMSFTTVAQDSRLVFDGVDAGLHAQESPQDGRTTGVDGLILDGHSGPWYVRNSRFRFLMVAGRKSDDGATTGLGDYVNTAGPGVIENSELTLVHLKGQRGPVVVRGDKPVSLIDAPGTVVIDEAHRPYLDRALAKRAGDPPSTVHPRG